MEETTPVPIPALLQRIATAGDEAAGQLARWGVRMPSTSRIALAGGLLRSAADQAQITPTEDAVLPILRALWVAADFADIGAYLPPAMVKSVRQELGIAVSGALWPASGSRQPLQYQTQHWIGAILQHSGLEPDHIGYSSKHPVKAPEFWIWNGATPIGVEVKRPESIRRIPDMLREAMQKFLTRECYAAIVVEISDCLRPDSQVGLMAQADAIARTMNATIMDQRLGIMNQGFERLIYAGCVFRNAWEVPPEDPSRLRLFGHAIHQGYPGRDRTLRAIRSDWFRGEMNRAFSAVVARVGALASRSVA